MDSRNRDTGKGGARVGPVGPQRGGRSHTNYQPKGSTYKTDKPPYIDRLPAFYSPSNMILGDMKAVIKKNAPPGDNSLVYQLLRTVLRKRLTQALGQARKKMDSKQIFNAYRELYPKTTDELIVKQTLDDIKASNLSDESTRVKKPDARLQNNYQLLKNSTYKMDKHIPAFNLPCNMILRDMKAVIKENAPLGENFIFYQLLRTVLRKRLSLALGKECKKDDSKQTKQIFNMYRELYPKTTDELIVKQILDDIKACDDTNDSAVASATAYAGLETSHCGTARPEAAPAPL